MNTTDALGRYVHVLFAVVLTVTVLHFGRDLIILSLISALFAFMLLPMARHVEKLGAPRWLGALAATLFLLAIVMGAFFFLGWQLSRFGKDIPALQERFIEKGFGVLGWIEAHTHIDQREQVRWFNDHVNELAEYGGKTLVKVFSSTGAALAFIVPIPIFVFLLLLLKDKFRIFFKQVGHKSNGLVLEVMVRISKLSRKYIRGVLIVILILGVLNSIGFLLLDLKYAILLGFLAGFLNIIPYIGVLIGSLFPILIALLTKDHIGYAIGALGVCLFTQFLENNLITPKVVGSSVSINPLASILALLGFGMLWGVVGMVVAIPLMGMLKIVCDAIPGLQPYGYLLGEDIDYPEEQRYNLPFIGRKRPAGMPPAHDPREV
ncbi:MAG: AI-2E family transporter [Flavobacteriales bacterium]|nr:AI-2E family transporter [Flavobacteriales bacterium]